MTTMHTLTAPQAGPVLLSISTASVDVDVTVDPAATHARIELDLSGPLPQGGAEKFTLTQDGNKVHFRLGASAGGGGVTQSIISTGDGTVIQSATSTGGGRVTQVGRNYGIVADVVHGDMVMGRGGVQFGNGMTQINTFGGGSGHSSMQVDGKLIEVINGKTYVNGRLVDGDQDESASPSDRPAPMPVVLRVRAIVPPGSGLNVDTAQGDVTSRGVRAVGIKTATGDVNAVGLARDSCVKTGTGDVTVSAAAGERPIVKVKTGTGDITAIGDVRLQPQTGTGSIRYRD